MRGGHFAPLWGHRRIFPKEHAKGAAIGLGFATEASCFFVWRPLRVEVHASDETVEIFVEADTDELPE